MAKTRYLEYTIHLTDRAAATARKLEYPNGIRVAPATAATTYAAPIQPRSQAFSAPCCRSPYFWGPGFPAIANYPQNEDSFTRKVGGWFGIGWLFGTTVNHIWVGKFVFGSGLTPEINGLPTEIVAIAQRRWASGFEIPAEGDQPSGGTAYRTFSRDASRHTDGMGWAFRGDSGTITSLVTLYKPGNTVRSHWERFYIRARKAPTGAAGRIWLGLGGAGNDGIEIKLTTGLQFAISNYASGVPTLLTSTSKALVLNAWTKIDIVLSFATGAGGTGAYCEVWINGAIAATVPSPGITGLGTQGAYASSALGGPTSTVEADFDDWIGAEVPTKDSLGRYAGLDWLNGSKVQRLHATGFGTGHDAVNWTNQEYSRLNVPAGEIQSVGNAMVSTTAAAAIVVNTDAAAKVDQQPHSLGIVALVVVAYHNGLTAGAHSIGYKIAGGTLDLMVMAATTGAAYARHMYRPAGLLAPTKPVAPLTLHYLKDNDITQDNVYSFGAVAEVIGTWGSEDVFPGVTAPATMAPRALGPHNNPYPDSPYARLSAPPAAPYIIHSGTYSGNGTGLDLYFRIPVHWLWIRRIDTAAFPPSLWFAPHLGSTPGGTGGVIGDRPVRAFIDPDFVGAGGVDAQEQRTIVRITGAHDNANFSGATYQYVAVCDPLARFLLTGGFHHGGVAVISADALAIATYLPESGFLHYHTPSADASMGAYFKGLGHAANAISILNAAENADFLGWSAGALAPQAVSTLLFPATYALWRRQDGSTDPGVSKVVQLGTYIGDGAASRTVGFGPIGVRPLWAIVVPHNGAAIFRDPGNLGTASKPISGINNVSTGITAGGIDSFTVGTALNAAGIVYSWMVLPGSATAGNGGWSIDGEFIPTEPDLPTDGPWPPGDTGIPPIPPPGGGNPDPDPGPDDDDDCLAGTVCVAATTRQVNMSLLELGVSKILTDYCTQTTAEAIIAKRLYEPCVRHTLVAYPWPFATKYATLALTTTQPTHADWAYAFRKPADCIFARRLVVSRGRAADPTPPPMGFSSDASGGIIFSNEATPVLEYTARPTCVAYNGDDLFLEALKWRLAAAMAPALTRIAGEADRCMVMFERILQKAEATIKPGVPGLRPGVDAGDPDTLATAIAANVQVVNRGLIRIGARTIANMTTEQSREAIAAKLVFEDELRATLRDFPWAFATRYNDAPTLVGGTATAPVNSDWQYSYRAPTDMVALRRLITDGTGRSYEATPKTHRMGSDVTGGLVFSHEVAPNFEYTARLANLMLFADPIFRDALAWRLAAAMAPSLAQVDPESAEQHGRGQATPQDPSQRLGRRERQQQARQRVAMWAWQMYERALEQAKVADANEQQQEPHGQAEWIDGRE